MCEKGERIHVYTLAHNRYECIAKNPRQLAHTELTRALPTACRWISFMDIRIPVKLQKKISEADQYQLDLIADSIFDFKSADDTLKYLQ